MIMMAWWFNDDGWVWRSSDDGCGGMVISDDG